MMRDDLQPCPLCAAYADLARTERRVNEATQALLLTVIYALDRQDEATAKTRTVVATMLLELGGRGQQSPPQEGH